MLPQFLQDGQSLEAYLSGHPDDVPDLVLTGTHVSWSGAVPSFLGTSISSSAMQKLELAPTLVMMLR